MRIEIGSGIECTVYDVGNGRCYKEYCTIEEAESAYENARTAFDAGIAPEVYEKDKYGYYTEIVETFGYLCDGCKNWHNCDDICDYAFNIIGRNEYQELCAELCEIFGENADYDLHIYNIGRKAGKLVAIDFGIESGIG